MTSTNERIEKSVFCEINDPGVEINKLRYCSALVGGFNKTGDTYYLYELAFLGDEINIVGGYKSYSEVKFKSDLFGKFLEEEAFEMRGNDLRDLEDILKPFLKK
jgi:hypothetical protein